MAEEVELEVKPAKSKLPIIIALVVVVLVGGGVAAWFLLGSTPSVEESAAASEQKPVAASAKIGDALYVAMPRALDFMIQGASRPRTVQIKVQLLVRGQDAEQLARKHIPLVEATLHKTFSATTEQELVSLAGKERLREQALSDVRETFLNVEGQNVVEQVLFTGFVIE
ncbi:flagellar basal body-associated protein FliL [Neiella marina]|uniref:Flagellar protein FliL n=1 Tax=Neiella holothuriorum TaxID=2870530 RepID=A0ABS7EEW2_9GAMM|nr:flagellar basal body-associated protein FliL [Neiella holothuriorum]MBW8190800.1 flagellar basal body-associated protein FliL [Neiella holothuriorum]